MDETIDDDYDDKMFEAPCWLGQQLTGCMFGTLSGFLYIIFFSSPAGLPILVVSSLV